MYMFPIVMSKPLIHPLIGTMNPYFINVMDTLISVNNLMSILVDVLNSEKILTRHCILKRFFKRQDSVPVFAPILYAIRVGSPGA